MARPKKSVLPYLLHRPSGRARVRINGRDVYLGRYNSPESLEEYRRLLAEHFENPACPGPTVAQDIAEQWTIARLEGGQANSSLIAHEIAHSIEEASSHTRNEEVADRLVREWGFSDELDALHARGEE
jgi:hypothetical protein